MRRLRESLRRGGMTWKCCLALCLVLAACAETNAVAPEDGDPDPFVGPDKSDDAQDTGLVQPACGGSAVHTSYVADHHLNAPGWKKPAAVIDTLGRGWTGTVSFRLLTYGCADVYSQYHFTNWQILDGNNNAFYSGYGPQNTTFQALTLPVTITAAGVAEGGSFPGNICIPQAFLEAIRFDTIGTSCIEGGVVRQRFGTGPNDWAKIIGNDMMPTKMTFSAQVKFFANYTAPDCARISFYGRTSGVTLTPATPVTSGLVELESPIYVDRRPSCQSSRLTAPEVPDADFQLTISKIALAVPQ